MSVKPTKAIEIFFSYSHRDDELRDELEKHLSILKRQGVITGWHDRKIGVGREWGSEIDTHLNTAHIILLLVSADFLASDYCYDVEMKRAMERHGAGEARVIPVILRPVDWKSAPFGKLQALPKDALPVTEWPSRDKAFLDVAQGIRAAVEELAGPSAGLSLTSEYQFFEQIPQVKFKDIGGLHAQIEEIRERIEAPYLFPNQYRHYGLTPASGILLYGPPGCGKTMLAEASATSLNTTVQSVLGTEKAGCVFLKMDAPRLRNRIVGEIESSIRSIFHQARRQASYQNPVVILLDDLHVFLGQRRESASQNLAYTVVPQLLAELDSLKGHEYIFVLAATYRPDMLDPALFRPGRLDFKIHVSRPDPEAAYDIFTKYLTPSLPIHPEVVQIAAAHLAKPLQHDALIEYAYDFLIETAVSSIYSPKSFYRIIPKTALGEVGERELKLSELVSGAFIASISLRAKRYSVRRQIQSRARGVEDGIHYCDLVNAIKEELTEHSDALVAQLFETQGETLPWDAFDATLALDLKLKSGHNCLSHL